MTAANTSQLIAYQAQALSLQRDAASSASNADLYHANALRPLAYMQYLQGKYEEAYTAIGKARRVAPDDNGITVALNSNLRA